MTEPYLNATELRKLSSGDFLQHLGQDGMRWTKAFRALNPDSTVDDDVMLGWFCNALCAGEDYGLARCGKIDAMWQRPWDRDDDEPIASADTHPQGGNNEDWSRS